ncbi:MULTISPECIES: acyl-CoA reductase [unclassified Pseudomonas]|uniref:acyl-CoA reductase n=1 Tax=unclassified Pseudomonas TaxID=196821 RepID=UPI000CD0AD4D|nr:MULTISPECIES: acyl-CoA reductase [unclassified Pseudomonas]POA35698.1 long-chain-fatty-acyl-CoA reductase [Pseudomonas sp. GW456-R21]POA71721.1 long-chain-fatty-acyl-CoA reductase [Pseudomonas sp. GW460-R15]
MYLINGQLHDSLTPEAALDTLLPGLAQQLGQPPTSERVLQCADRFTQKLLAHQHPLELDEGQRLELIAFCQRSALSAKLERELGVQPRSLRRIAYDQPRFENWSPLGLVVHITPANAPLLGFCAVLESLLVGNINWLRPSSSDNSLSAQLLAAFLECDASGLLANCIAVLPVDTDRLDLLCAHADGVSAWGGDAALKAIRRLVPSGCRWIDWGHKISFAYLSPEAVSPAALDTLVDEVCRLDQQACSSPQWLLVDSDDPQTLHAVGGQLADAFERRARRWPALLPTAQEACEITTRIALARLDQSFADETGRVWSGDGWRIMWEHHRRLAPSPLFRTLLLRPMPNALIAESLLPWRTYLQSCALICTPRQTPSLVRQLLSAGVNRIAPPELIHQGYAGEPHDGVFALSRFTRRTSVTLPPQFSSNRATLDQPPGAPAQLNAYAVMNKADFIAQSGSSDAQLFFRSGGTSGTPALAGYSYRDFSRQMRAAADGMFAIGLTPGQDRVMNLFYGGSLYGGLFSFSRILEQMGVTHFPMGGPHDDDFSEIAQLIVDQRINTLIGMPSTLQRLFFSEQDRLKAYGGVNKVFMGGEHSGNASRRLMERCGVSTIRSALYGSVDAGPLGHACPASADGVFHLMSDIQWLEIVNLEHDAPVEPGEVGRLLFTSRAREGQTIIRYEVGDTGRWLPATCPCGLDTPRFELQGRHGRLLRIASDFVSISDLEEQAATQLQLLLDHDSNGTERLVVRAEHDPQTLRQRLLGIPVISTAVNNHLLELDVQRCSPDRFERNRHSGKVPLIIDLRTDFSASKHHN